MEVAGETVGEKPQPTKIHGFTIDLVHKLRARNNSPGKFEGKVVQLNGNARLEDEGEIELSLGLSLNGKFGVDPKRAQLKLIRASSVSTLALNCEEENRGHGVQVGLNAPPLIRTCSLPSVMEEELRKRKELQSLRRVEVKRRRMDKLRFSKEGREKVDVKEKCSVENGSNNNCSDLGFFRSNAYGAKPVLQGSELASQGSGSSGISELESNSIQDSPNNDAKALHSIHSQLPEPERKVAVNPGPSNIHSRHCHTDHKPPIAPRDKPSTSSVVATGAVKETMQLDGFKNNMPFVSTIDKGPDGKRIEGFLYRYQKGEEVKIVCVCHGSMFSPAEFVRHGGGGDVDHPLRHIVVGSRPFL